LSFTIASPDSGGVIGRSKDRVRRSYSGREAVKNHLPPLVAANRVLRCARWQLELASLASTQWRSRAASPAATSEAIHTPCPFRFHLRRSRWRQGQSTSPSARISILAADTWGRKRHVDDCSSPSLSRSRAADGEHSYSTDTSVRPDVRANAHATRH